MYVTYSSASDEGKKTVFLPYLMGFSEDGGERGIRTHGRYPPFTMVQGG
jgi:hypothetical protein